MSRPTRDNPSIPQQDGQHDDERDLPLDVERQQQASDHTNVQPGSAPASNEHGGRRLGETGGGKPGEPDLG